jgi:hypothetical protein
MSIGILDEEKLQQFYDGELGPDGVGEVRAALEASEETRGRLVALEKLGELVRGHLADAPSNLADDLFSRIEAGIADTPAPDIGADEVVSKTPAHPGLRVIAGDRTSAPDHEVAPADPSTRPARPELWKVWIPAAAAFAAAAAVLLAVFSTPDVEGPAVDRVAPAVQVEEPVVTYVEAPHGTEVVEVDFGQNIGTVFEVQGEAGEPIAVVWISEEDLGSDPTLHPPALERVQ